MTLLLRQGADVDLVLRMMAGEYRTEEGGQKVSYYNKPSDKVGYAMFRRIVLQLSTIQDRSALFATRVPSAVAQREFVTPPFPHYLAADPTDGCRERLGRRRRRCVFSFRHNLSRSRVSRNR